MRKGDVEILEDNKSLEVQMEEILEKFEGEKDNDKFVF